MMDFIVYYLLILLALKKEGNHDDPELLLSIKAGDHKAFKTFFKTHHAFLYHFLLKKGMSEQQSEDLVQQAFVLIWEKRSEINVKKSLRAYLFKIAYNRMLNVIRDNSKFEDNVTAFEGDSYNEPDHPIQNTELATAIDKAIQSMPNKRQTVFRLCFIQEFTYRDAADILNVSHKTIENHMGLALKELREKLIDFR